MIRRIVSFDGFFAALVALLISGGAVLAADGAAIYADHCASCHGERRLGKTGPALFSDSLGRLKGDKLEAVIRDGRPMTQMPSFAATLGSPDIAAVAAYINAPLEQQPVWGVAEITASRRMAADYRPSAKPVFDADPMNVTLVVETGDSHISVLDGDSLKVLDRFATPFAVHGGPKFSPDGRFVFIVSRDGWVQKYDLWSLQEVGQVRVGINSRNIAISYDGQWLAVANYLPQTLIILSAADLSVVQVMPVASAAGTPSRVSAVYQAPQRKSFILALKDVPEIWEVSKKTGEEGAKPVFVSRRISTEAPLDDFFFDKGYRNLIGANRDAGKGVVVDLDDGRQIAELPLPGMPHLGSGISWLRNGHRVMAAPHLEEGRISIIDMTDWTLLKVIPTSGPGFFLRSHDGVRHIWADVFTGPNRGEMHLIDKQTLDVVRVLKPAPGKTVAHTEFTRDGTKALVSIWEQDGAVIVYDTKTLKEIARLPMRKPSGKYNVWNKINFEDGTSH